MVPLFHSAASQNLPSTTYPFTLYGNYLLSTTKIAHIIVEVVQADIPWHIANLIGEFTVAQESGDNICIIL